METVGAVVGIVAAVAQCVEAAKACYDLKEKYNEASMTITSIYTESMVIAASLTQLQNLLQGDTLQKRPELYEPFDHSVTACQILYACLHDGVRELNVKAESKSLRSRDRVKFVWKEDGFQEILQQIRGQQIALSLLIQGLQMESMADIRRLVEENNAKLEEVVHGSNELRSAHPEVKVPDSIFNLEMDPQSLSDAQSILSSMEFSFDDEVINSKAYRRVLSPYALRTTETLQPTVGVEEADLIDLSSPVAGGSPKGEVAGAVLDLQSLNIQTVEKEENEAYAEPGSPHAEPDTPATHADLLMDVERSLLPFMPPSTLSLPDMGSLLPDTARTSQENPVVDKVDEEKPPPLPPRRPEVVQPAKPSTRLDGDFKSTPSILSDDSTESSVTLADKFEGFSKSVDAYGSPPPLRKSASVDIFKGLSFKPERLVRVATLEDIELHQIWVSVREEEEKFIDRITRFRIAFYEPAIKVWPALEKHLEAIKLSEKLVALHWQYLLGPIQDQLSQKTFAACDPSIFGNWAAQTHKTYQNIAQRLPHTEAAIRATQVMDKRFAPFMAKLGLSQIWFEKSWRDFVSLPITQLDSYVTRVEELLSKIQNRGAEEPPTGDMELLLMRVLQTVQTLRSGCLTLMKRASEREELQTLYRRIRTVDASLLSRLSLDDPSRKILLRGTLAIKANKSGPWRSVHIVLLDNYFFWANVKSLKKSSKSAGLDGSAFWLFEEPIPIEELDVIEASVDNQFSKATILDNIPKGTVVHHFFVRSRTSGREHLLGANSLNERREWLKKLKAATGGG